MLGQGYVRALFRKQFPPPLDWVEHFCQSPELGTQILLQKLRDTNGRHIMMQIGGVYNNLPVGPFAAAISSLFLERSSFTCSTFLQFKAVLGPKRPTIWTWKPTWTKKKAWDCSPNLFLLKEGLGTAVSSQFWAISIDRDRTETGQICNISFWPFLTVNLEKNEKFVKNRGGKWPHGQYFLPRGGHTFAKYGWHHLHLGRVTPEIVRASYVCTVVSVACLFICRPESQVPSEIH